jgi:hypothetical protein
MEHGRNSTFHRDCEKSGTRLTGEHQPAWLELVDKVVTPKMDVLRLRRCQLVQWRLLAGRIQIRNAFPLGGGFESLFPLLAILARSIGTRGTT